MGRIVDHCSQNLSSKICLLSALECRQWAVKAEPAGHVVVERCQARAHHPNVSENSGPVHSPVDEWQHQNVAVVVALIDEGVQNFV